MSFDSAIRKLNHRRIDRMRAWKLAIAKFLFDSERRLTKAGDDAPVLVLRLDDKLGDSIVATGFLREIKARHPDRPLIVVAGPGNAGIYRSLDFIDEVLVCKKGFASAFQAFLSLRNRRYYAILNTSHILNPRVIFLLGCLTAEKKIGFENEGFRLFTDVVTFDERKDHVTVRYGRALAKIGRAESDLTYELKISPEAHAAATVRVAEIREKFPVLIVLNSFAGARLRNFSFETTKKIVEELIKDSAVCVVSVANAGDHRILGSWVAQLNSPQWRHFPELSSLEQNFALVQMADLVITPDTAMVHMASAFRKKLLAVYREDKTDFNSVNWAPFGTEYRIIYARSESYDINDFSMTEFAGCLRQLKAAL